MADNENPNSSVDQTPAKNTLAALVALVFVLTTGYLAFNYFNKTILNVNETSKETREATEKQTNNGNTDQNEEGKINDTQVVQEGANDEEGEILTGANTVRTEEPADSETENVDNNTNSTQIPNEQIASDTASWRANDYKQGDINKGQYEVQQGDTLWEIAEAAYGNGADWVNILQANADSIGTLSSGQQALIVPGQVLTLP